MWPHHIFAKLPGRVAGKNKIEVLRPPSPPQKKYSQRRLVSIAPVTADIAGNFSVDDVEVLLA